MGHFDRLFAICFAGKLTQRLINTLSDNLLGSAVAELLVENYPIPMKRIGVRDTFAESGPYLEVIEKYGLTAPHIQQAVLEVIARRKEYFRI